MYLKRLLDFTIKYELCRRWWVTCGCWGTFTGLLTLILLLRSWFLGTVTYSTDDNRMMSLSQIEIRFDSLCFLVDVFMLLWLLFENFFYRIWSHVFIHLGFMEMMRMKKMYDTYLGFMHNIDSISLFCIHCMMWFNLSISSCSWDNYDFRTTIAFIYAYEFPNFHLQFLIRTMMLLTSGIYESAVQLHLIFSQMCLVMIFFHTWCHWLR